MKNIRFAVLDIDGTILDSKKLCRKMIKLFYSQPLLFQLYLKTFEGNLTNQLICKVADILDGNPKKFRGVQEFLKRLKKKNIEVFGSTRSNLKDVKRILKEEKIEKFFSLIKGNELVKKEHIPCFAKKTGTDVKEFCKKAIYIGDEPADAYIAKKMNILSVIVTNTFTKKELEKIQEREVLIVKELKEAIK